MFINCIYHILFKKNEFEVGVINFLCTCGMEVRSWKLVWVKWMGLKDTDANIYMYTSLLK